MPGVSFGMSSQDIRARYGFWYVCWADAHQGPHARCVIQSKLSWVCGVTGMPQNLWRPAMIQECSDDSPEAVELRRFQALYREYKYYLVQDGDR